MATYTSCGMRTLVATCLICSFGSAIAQATSSASISGLQYTLTDLDPDDGIAPSLTWGSSTVTNSLRVQTQTGVGSYWGAQLGTPIFAVTFDQTTTTPGDFGTAGELVFNGHNSTSNAQGLSVTASAPLGAYWTDTAAFQGNFSLSAKTAVTFFAQAQASVGVHVPADAPLTIEEGGYRSNGYFDWAYIQAESLASLTFTGGVPYLEPKDNLSAWVRDYVTATDNGARLLSATYNNDTSQSLDKGIQASLWVSGYTVTPLVPEPATWAQWLIGLVGIGTLGWLRGARRIQH